MQWTRKNKVRPRRRHSRVRQSLIVRLDQALVALAAKADLLRTLRWEADNGRDLRAVRKALAEVEVAAQRTKEEAAPRFTVTFPEPMGSLWDE